VFAVETVVSCPADAVHPVGFCRVSKIAQDVT
jgi:hypothetical protein